MYFLYDILGARVSISSFVSYESLLNELISLGVNNFLEIGINSKNMTNIAIIMMNSNLLYTNSIVAW